MAPISPHVKAKSKNNCIILAEKYDNKIMDKENEEKAVKFNLRLPVEVYERLGKQAAKNLRSINNEIVMIILNHFAIDDGQRTFTELYRLIEDKFDDLKGRLQKPPF
jgi:hypothetical protein